MTDESPAGIERRLTALEAEVRTLRVLLGAAAGATASGFEAIDESLDDLEAAVFGNT